MATARRAYTAEYQYGFTPEVQPERVRRTRQRPEVNGQQEQRQETILIIAVVLIGAMFICMVVVNAQAAKFQYSINQLRSQNTLLENEIGSLNIKIERETGIQNLEKYATEKLNMFYPQGEQCVHVSTLSTSESSLAELIKQKAYE